MNTIKRKKNSGFVLVTGLVFVLVIMLVTVATMQSSNLDYKISSNEAFKDIAFQGSESGRVAAGEAVVYYIYSREWTGLQVSNLTYLSDYDPATDSVGPNEDLYDTSSLNVDMQYDVSGPYIETIDADINIVKAPGARSKGSGLQQLSGYEGLGKGAGAGGVHLIYEIRSTGEGASGAVAVTASELRVVP